MYRAQLHSRLRVSFWLVLLFSLFYMCACSRASSQAAAVEKPEPQPIDFVGEWGVRGTDPGQLEDPVGPAMDSVGRVYVADRATGFVQKFEANGVPLLSFESPAARTADSIAVDSGGAIYVTNSHTGAMQLFFPQGDPLRILRVAPERGSEGPFVFSIDADGKIYVPDPLRARVQVFSTSGLLLKFWRILPDASEKAALPFAAVADRDAVYVGDAADARILKFTLEGVQIAGFNEPNPDDASRLLGLVVAAKHVFALRGFPLRIEIWSPDGHREWVDTLGGRLSAIKSAAYLAGDGAGDFVVLDPEGSRVLHFRVRSDLP